MKDSAATSARKREKENTEILCEADLNTTSRIKESNKA